MRDLVAIIYNQQLHWVTARSVRPTNSYLYPLNTFFDSSPKDISTISVQDLSHPLPLRPFFRPFLLPKLVAGGHPAVPL